MKKIQLKTSFNILISFLLLSQFTLFLFNINKTKTSISYLPDSIEKFRTIISGKNGVDIITADKMIKINNEKTMLIGNTKLENHEYEISSKNVTVDSGSKLTSSNNDTVTTNDLGTVISEGFEYNQSSNTIIFKGESEFYSNGD